MTRTLRSNEVSVLIIMMLHTHHKHFLHSPDAFAEYGAKLISHTSQEEPKQRYPQQGIHNAKDPSTLCVWRSVAKTCREETLEVETDEHVISK